MHFFTSSQCFWMALTLQDLKLGGNLEFSWYSCNILRYCSNRCIVWFFIPANCPAQANRKFPVQLYVKSQIIFEPPFWICKWANHLSFLAMGSATERMSDKPSTFNSYSMNKYIENFAYSSIVSENKIRRQAGVARFLLSFTDSYLKNWCWKIRIWFTEAYIKTIFIK